MRVSLGLFLAMLALLVWAAFSFGIYGVVIVALMAFALLFLHF